MSYIKGEYLNYEQTITVRVNKESLLINKERIPEATVSHDSKALTVSVSLIEN
jgi:hypothetical protein